MRLLFRLLSLTFIATFLASCDGLGSPSPAYDPFARPFEGTFAYVGCEGNDKNCAINDAAWADSSIVIEKFDDEVTTEDVLPGLEANQLFIGDDYVDYSSEGRIDGYYVITVVGPDIGGPYSFWQVAGSVIFCLYGYEGEEPWDASIGMKFLERKLTKEKRIDLFRPHSDFRLVFMTKG